MIKSLNQGLAINVDLAYYFNRTSGIGIKHTTYSSSASVQGVEGSLFIFSIIPYYTARIPVKEDRDFFYFNVGVGYMGYSESRDTLDWFGYSPGFSMDVGYDIALYRRWSIGIRGSYLFGAVSKITVNDGKTTTTINLRDQLESLEHINITVGARYRF